MSFFDNLKGKAEELKGKASELIGGNSDQVKDGIEKAGDFFDDKTGGKFKDQVDGVQSGANDLLNKLGGKEGEAATDAPEAPAQDVKDAAADAAGNVEEKINNPENPDA